MYGEKKMKKSKKITGIAGATLIGTTVFYLKTRRKAKKERTKKEQIQQKENQQEQKKQSQKKSIQAHKQSTGFLLCFSCNHRSFAGDACDGSSCTDKTGFTGYFQAGASGTEW